MRDRQGRPSSPTHPPNHTTTDTRAGYHPHNHLRPPSPMPVTNKKLTTAVEDYFTDLRSICANVWTSKLGGYQVLKKWLFYREQKVLGRPLNL